MGNVAKRGALPLFALVGIGLGCATGIDQKDPTSAPQVVAVHAADTQGALQDVLLWSSTDTRSTPKIPVSYGALRIEFDQLLTAQGFAHTLDLSSQTFCSPVNPDPTQATFQFLDAGDSNKVIPSSICYSPQSVTNGNPSVTLTFGNTVFVPSTRTPPPPSPFTCQTFSPQRANSDGAVLKFSNPYALLINANNVQGVNGKTLVTPAAPPWSPNGQLSVTSSGFEIMAAGFNDNATGYFTWLAKPFAGYMKDCTVGKIACNQDPSDPTKFILPTTRNDFLVVVTARVKSPVPVPGSVNVTRLDGSAFGFAVVVPKDARRLLIRPAGTWEPGVQYTIQIAPSLASAGMPSTALGGNPVVYSVQGNNAPLKVISVDPVNNAQAIATNKTVSLTFQAPVAVDTAGNVSGNIVLSSSKGPVPARASRKLGTNGQVVTIAPSSPLDLATSYTISAQNVATATTPPSLAGQTFAPLTSQFVTANFRIALLSLNGTDSIDNTTDVEPTALQSGLQAAFTGNPDPTTVNSSSLVLSEVGQSGEAPVAGPTISQSSGTTWSLKAPPGYKLKLGQKYRVRATSLIRDSTGTLQVTAEGCKSGDCSDARSFTTVAMGPVSEGGFIWDPKAAGGVGAVLLTFTETLQASSVNPNLNQAMKLFSKDAQGNLTPVPLSCTALPDDNQTTISCPTPGLTPNTTYVATAIFTTLTPAVVAPTLGGFPVDQTTGQFVGALRTTFQSPCP